MDVTLYSTAVQTVPLLLIALFLDRNRSARRDDRDRSERLQAALDRVFALLGCIAFVVSLLVIVEAIPAGAATAAVVIAALAGSMGLLLTQIWNGFDRRH